VLSLVIDTGLLFANAAAQLKRRPAYCELVATINALLPFPIAEEVIPHVATL
jgi:hypothetical protein